MMADGEIDDSEMNFLHKVGSKMGMDKNTVEDFYDLTVEALTKHFYKG